MTGVGISTVTRGSELLSPDSVSPWPCGYASAQGEPWGELARLESGSSGRRERVENTKALRKRVLEVAGCIREARQNIDAEIRVSPQHWQCRVCGQRSRCSQAR